MRTDPVTPDDDLTPDFTCSLCDAARCLTSAASEVLVLMDRASSWAALATCADAAIARAARCCNSTSASFCAFNCPFRSFKAIACCIDCDLILSSNNACSLLALKIASSTAACFVLITSCISFSHSLLMTSSCLLDDSRSALNCSVAISSASRACSNCTSLSRSFASVARREPSLDDSSPSRLSLSDIRMASVDAAAERS